MKKYSIAEPVTDLKRIAIVDNGEPLVDYLALCPDLIIARPRWSYTRASYLREGVAKMLCKAAQSLPDGYRLAVLEGWRPEYIQKRMYLSSWQRWKERHPEWSDVQLRRVVNRFTAPLHGKVPPPHSTGAAFDLVLANQEGWELDMISPFEMFDPRAYETYAPGLSQEAMTNRRILIESLESAGLTNYPSEWWHWSYGDQGWAYRTGASHAIYGKTTPLDWPGIVSEMVEEPLERAYKKQ